MKTTIILLVCFLSFSVYSQDKKNKHNVRLYLSGNLSNDVKQTTIKKAIFNGDLSLKYINNADTSSCTITTYTIFLPGHEKPLTGKGNRIKPEYENIIKNSKALEVAVSVSYNCNSKVKGTTYGTWFLHK